MASSHHLMTVCMFCLLCATHSSCSAHDGMVSGEQHSKTFQDLMKHGKFKKNILMDAMPDENLRIQQIPKSKDSQSYVAVEVNNNYNNEDTLSDVGNNLIGFKKNYLPHKLLGKSKRNKEIKSADVVQDENISSDDKNQYRSELGLQHDARKDFDVPSEFKVSQEMKYIKQYSSTLNSLVNESRPKRDVAALETEKANDAPVDYRISLKNIDADFYVRELFMKFGNKDTMTMDLEGFDRMLKQLDLDRMVVEFGKIENGISVQKPPVEKVINGVRYNSTNVTCVNSIDLVSSLNKQYDYRSTPDTHQTNVRNESHQNATGGQSLSELKSRIFINAQVLTKICPILLYQKISNTSYERQGCLEERKYPKVTSNGDDHHHHIEYNQDSNNRTTVWIYSSLCILFISLCGLLGIVVIPIMEHVYYQQILQFLVALGVGTLSGDALLHLLPHALSPDIHDHDHSHIEGEHAHSHSDGMYKGLVAMIGVVFFYFIEKFLNLISEWRQKKMKMNKENKLPSRVRVMRNDIGCLKGSGSCSSHTGRDGFLKFPTLTMFKPQAGNKNGEPSNVQSSGKICKHKYSEYPYCYDEITTDTLDDHHLRDMSKNSSNDRAPNKSITDNINKESPLSVVSLNVMNDHGEQYASEAGVNDALLTNDGKVNNVTIVANNSTHKNNISDNDTHNRRSGVKIMDGHKRSRSADRAGELEDYNAHKKRNEESYTVILREHSQNHHGHSHSHGHVHSPPSSLSSVVWMVIMGDGLHNFTDGMAIGAAFSSNIAGGFSTAIAVLCHELPHEIGDFAVLLKAGMSAKRAVFYNMLSSILCLFGMMVGVCAGHTPEASAWIFAAAAGMFLYIALVDMIPELSSSHSNEGALCQCIIQLSGLSCGIGIMFVIAMYEDHLKKLFG